MNNIKFCLIFYFLIAGNIFALGSKEADPENKAVISSAQNVIQQTKAEPTRAEQVMRALAAAYPHQIEKVEFRNNDWAVLLRGVWYYYSESKLLPQNLLPNSADYSPQPFYNYAAELPAWKAPGAEEAERYRSMANSRNRNPPRRSPQFFDELWQAHNRDEAYERVKRIRFLEKTVTVHNLISENLSFVEEKILAEAKVNPQVQNWINGINSLEGWSWRNIADTQSRSYHSYGLAVDIMPKSYGGKETYWLWASDKRPDWWNISYNERYHPPAAVIKAFETYGFIWGGKWLYFDTMHFEYRPEILILSGMRPETRR